RYLNRSLIEKDIVSLRLQYTPEDYVNNNSVYMKFLFGVYPPYVVPTGADLSLIAVGENHTIRTDFSLTKSKLLSHPYSNCIDYPNIGYQSHQDCRDKCLIYYTMKYCKWWLRNINIPEQNASSKIRFRGDHCNVLGTGSNRTNINKMCTNQCQFNDCVYEYYTLRVTQ